METDLARHHPALPLHSASSMKARLALFVAALVLGACGVGVDGTLDGTDSAPQSQTSELTAAAKDPGKASEIPANPKPSGASGVLDPSTVALPQDPIPVFEGKPLPVNPLPNEQPGYPFVPPWVR